MIGTSEEIDAKISVYELVERTKEETASWAQQGNTDSIPTEKLANAGRTGGQTEGLTQPQVDQRINSLIPPNRRIPAGGTQGQVLAKSSATDFDTDWKDDVGQTAAQVEASVAARVPDGGKSGEVLEKEVRYRW